MEIRRPLTETSGTPCLPRSASRQTWSSTLRVSRSSFAPTQAIVLSPATRSSIPRKIGRFEVCADSPLGIDPTRGADSRQVKQLRAHADKLSHHKVQVGIVFRNRLD